MDWKKTLASVAPTIGAAIGGPMGGVAAKVAMKALGIEGESEDWEGELERQIKKSDPTALAKLKKADNDFKVEMKRLDIDIYAKDVEDRGSARDMAIKTGLSPQVLLSIVFVAGFVMVLYYLFAGTSNIPDNMMQPAMYVLGILSAGIIQIMNFWFGSSSGSHRKTAEIPGLLKR